MNYDNLCKIIQEQKFIIYGYFFLNLNIIENILIKRQKLYPKDKHIIHIFMVKI